MKTQDVDSIEKKDSKNVTVRVPIELHKQARRRFADGDEGFQSLFVGYLARWVANVDSEKKPAQVEFGDLTPAERAKVEAYAAALLHGRKTKEMKVPDDLVEVVTGFINFMLKPDQELHEDIRAGRIAIQQMFLRWRNKR